MKYLGYKHKESIIIGNRKFSYFILDNIIKKVENGKCVYVFDNYPINSSDKIFSIHLQSSKKEKLVRRVLKSLGISSKGSCLNSYNERIWYNPLTLKFSPNHKFRRNYMVEITTNIKVSSLPGIFEELRKNGFKTTYYYEGSFSKEVII